MNSTTTTTIQFEAGKTYLMRFIGDSQLKVAYTCLSRTAKQAVFVDAAKSEIIKRSIKSFDGVEYVLYGNYSMSPIIKADLTIS